jgi:hypothetical protein
MIAELLGSSGAAAIFVFQAAVDGKGTNPFRLALFPRLMLPHVGDPVDEVIAIVVEPTLVESCVEVAVIVTVSGGVPAGVKVTPAPEATPVNVLSVPSADGDTERFTVFVNAPVPVTVGVQLEVCKLVMDDAVHTIETPVMVGDAAVTVIFAEPEMFVNPVAAEWAVQVEVPLPDGLKTPPDVIVPPVAVQVTAEL